MADKLHRTIQGETWDIVSKIYYGSEKYVHELLKANPEYKDYIIFSAGLYLKIPEIELENPQELPPWRR